MTSPPKLRLAIVGPTHPFRGGISHHTTLLFRHLRERHDTRFFAFRRQYPMWLYPAQTDRDPSEQPLAEPGVVHALDSLNPLTWIRVAMAIREFNPDAVIIPWWVAFWAPQMWTISRLVRFGRTTSVLFICHNVVEHEPSAMRAFLTRRALRSGTAFLVHSDEDRANLEAIVPGAIVEKAALPSFGEVAAQRVTRAEARRRLDLGTDERILLFFGFVRPYKGLMRVIDAMPQILAHTEVRLVIAGEFWHDRADYLNRIEELGLSDRITVIDRYVPNEEVGTLFAAADIVVQPYETATQSAVTQLAFDLDRPVVVTDVGGLPETVDDRKTGYVVPAADSSPIAVSVIDFFANDRGESMERAILETRDRFGWPRFVDAVERLLRRCDRRSSFPV